MATTFASESSFMSVASDLVTERNVFWKLMLGCVYLSQLCSSIALPVAFYLQGDRTLEMILTLTILSIGLLATTLVNVISYFSKSRVQSKVTEQKDRSAEANSSEWIIAKVMCSVFPLCPIIRYVESTRASGKLLSLERRLITEHGGTLGQKSTFSTSKSQKSAAGKMAMDGVNLMEEDTQKSIRRQRRYFRRCERMAAIVALLHASLVAAPLVFLQLYFLFRQDTAIELSNQYTSPELKCMLSVMGTSVVWMSLALTQFYPARRVTFDPDGERSVQIRFAGMSCIFLWHFFMVSGRVLSFAVFAHCYHWWVLAVVGAHWLICVITFNIYRRLSPGYSSATQLTGSATISLIIYDLYYSWISVFDFINANQGKTRMRYLMYYMIFYTENIIMLMSWYASNCVTSDSWYKLPVLFGILFSFFLGFIFMQVYYLWLHSDNSLSVFDLCKRLFSVEQRRQMYMGSLQLIDPVTGQPAVGPDGKPFWHNRDDVFRAPSHAMAPSVYTFSAAASSHAHSMAGSSDHSGGASYPGYWQQQPRGPQQPMMIIKPQPIMEGVEMKNTDIANLDDVAEVDAPTSHLPPSYTAATVVSPPTIAPKPTAMKNPGVPPKPKPKPRFQKSLEDVSNDKQSRSSSQSSGSAVRPQKQTDF